MLTYSGRFKGTTLDAPNPKLKIIFPEAPAVVSSFSDRRSKEETDNP